MYDHIVIRYAEIALKGKNQKDFLNRLVHNIKEQVKTDLDITPVIEREMGRLYLKLEGRAPELFYDSLNHVFGISSYSPARKTGFELELTWLRDWDRPYNLGDNEIHLAFVTEDFEAAHAKHKEMGCICFENEAMGIYFINDPDGYWLEILPMK